MKTVMVLLSLGAALLCSSPVFASGREGGGGDPYVQDFVIQANRAYHWLAKHGGELKPQVDAGAFLNALNSAIAKSEIQSTSDLLEWNGVPKDAIYTTTNDVTYIIRSRYNLENSSSQEEAKIRFAAHEIFRRMGLEGDQYELSKQMDIEGIATLAEQTRNAIAWLETKLGGKSLVCEPADHHKPYAPDYRGDDGYFKVSAVKGNLVVSDNGGNGYGFANGELKSIAHTDTAVYLSVGDDGEQTLQFDFENLGDDSDYKDGCAGGVLNSQPDLNDYDSMNVTCCVK